MSKKSPFSAPFGSLRADERGHLALVSIETHSILCMKRAAMTPAPRTDAEIRDAVHKTANIIREVLGGRPEDMRILCNRAEVAMRIRLRGAAKTGVCRADFECCACIAKCALNAHVEYVKRDGRDVLLMFRSEFERVRHAQAATLRREAVLAAARQLVDYMGALGAGLLGIGGLCWLLGRWAAQGSTAA